MSDTNSDRQSRERKNERPEGNKIHSCKRKAGSQRNDDEVKCDEVMCEYVGKISLTRRRFNKIKKRLLRNIKESSERPGVTTRKMLRDEEIKRFSFLSVCESQKTDYDDSTKTGCLEWSSEEMRLYPQPRMTLVPDPHFQLSKM